MAGVGRISLLIDSPLRTVWLAFRGLEPDVRKQITSHTKRLAEPVWKEETSGHALSRLQQRVLAGTSRVGVSGLSMTLRAGGAGRLSSGTPTSLIAHATEWGADPETKVTVRNRKGTTFQRRMGTRFGGTRRQGNTVMPAARAVIPRMASLVVQTTIRTVHELVEKVSR
jgi:hypothetical protein